MDRDVKRNIAENAPIENPPEGGAGRDPLQDLSPEACRRMRDSGHSPSPALRYL